MNATNGWTTEDLAKTAKNVMRQMSPDDFGEADFLWEAVVDIAIIVCDIRGDSWQSKDISFSKFGAGLAKTYDGRESFSSIRDTMAWNALGRHLFNIINSEGTLDVPYMEHQIVQWFKKKLDDLYEEKFEMERTS